MPFMADLQGPIIPNRLMKLSLIDENLSPASFNWQTIILTQSMNSPALQALVILYKKSESNKMPIPSVSSFISYTTFWHRLIRSVLGFDFLFWAQRMLFKEILD